MLRRATPVPVPIGKAQARQVLHVSEVVPFEGTGKGLQGCRRVLHGKETNERVSSAEGGSRMK
jgi:hypothetical protein